MFPKNGQTLAIATWSSMTKSKIFSKKLRLL